jgi:hypothetical protein
LEPKLKKRMNGAADPVDHDGGLFGGGPALLARYLPHKDELQMMRLLLVSIVRRRTALSMTWGLLFALAASGCGPSQPRPLDVSTDNVASLDPHMPFVLPANTRLEALNKCVVSFPGTDLFEPGDVIGEIVVIDDDALMHVAPNNEKISLHLERGHSMSIGKSRTITVDETEATPCRFKVTPSDGT